MPKPVSSVPESLKPYVFHGVQLDVRAGTSQAIADCPFCLGDRKFYVDVSEGKYKCMTCTTGTEKGGGNIYTFLRKLHEASVEATGGDFSGLNKISDRKLMYETTMNDWGVCKSIITGDWMVPAYGADGKLNQLYRYLPDLKTKKYRLLATLTLNHHLHGVNLFDPSKPNVFVCEGPWDAMALYEVLQNTKDVDGKLTMTGNVTGSLFSESNVLAVPGCGVFNDSWCKLFGGKDVALLYDNDHPRVVAGKTLEPAAFSGMKKAITTLSRSAEDHPNTVSYLNWGDGGYTIDHPHGYDVRDLLTTGAKSIADRVNNLNTLMGVIAAVPAEWIPGRDSSAPAGSTQITWPKCESYAEMIEAWEKAMRWGPGLEWGLSTMLACILSVKSLGDQLWVKCIGPASCGKTTLCEAVSVNSRYVIAKSTMRGFLSGYDDGQGTDMSLIAQCRDKTLVTKDGDTLLQSPNLPQILSEARDIYDTSFRSSYRTKASRDYTLRMTWILCGTASLHALDSSELGERFLDYYIMDGIDDETEDGILDDVLDKALSCVKMEAGSDGDKQSEPTMLLARQRTAGYIDYLKKYANDLISAVVVPVEAKKQFKTLGKLVAYMRARPSVTQDETAERELAARLVSQLARLAVCTAAVMQKTEVDAEVMQRVVKVATDTARGPTLDIVEELHRLGDDGSETKALSLTANISEEKTRNLLTFMKRIGILETYVKRVAAGLAGKTKWRLTPVLKKVYQSTLDIVGGTT